MQDQRTGITENTGGHLRLDCHLTDIILLTLPNGQEVEVKTNGRKGDYIKYAIRAPHDVKILRLKGQR